MQIGSAKLLAKPCLLSLGPQVAPVAETAAPGGHYRWRCRYRRWLHADRWPPASTGSDASQGACRLPHPCCQPAARLRPRGAWDAAPAAAAAAPPPPPPRPAPALLAAASRASGASGSMPPLQKSQEAKNVVRAVAPACWARQPAARVQTKGHTPFSPLQHPAPSGRQHCCRRVLPAQGRQPARDVSVRCSTPLLCSRHRLTQGSSFFLAVLQR